jgi:hypothetical protein
MRLGGPQSRSGRRGGETIFVRERIHAPNKDGENYTIGTFLVVYLYQVCLADQI